MAPETPPSSASSSSPPPSMLSAETQELLRAGTALRPWPDARRDALWTELSQRPRRRDVGSLVWFAAGAATVAVLIAVGVGVVRRGPDHAPVATGPVTPAALAWSEVAVQDVGRLWLSPGARVRRTASRPEEVSLDSGSLRAEIRHRSSGDPFVVLTPQLRIVDVGTVFQVDVAADATQVSVTEGRVRLERGANAIEVAAGQSARSDDSRLIALATPAPPASVAPAAPAAPALIAPVPSPIAAPSPSLAFAPSLTRQQAAIPKCEAQASGADRDACYAHLAAGSGIDAESALVAMALEKRDRGDHAGALAALRSYQQRFPAGLFAPEVGIELVLELDDGTPASTAEAVTFASYFEKRYPKDPRTVRVALLRARLLRTELGQPAEALAVVEPMVNGGFAQSTRSEALFEAGLDETALHREADAQATWDRYLRDFPQGSHAAEVRAAQHP